MGWTVISPAPLQKRVDARPGVVLAKEAGHMEARGLPRNVAASSVGDNTLSPKNGRTLRGEQDPLLESRVSSPVP